QKTRTAIPLSALPSFGALAPLSRRFAPHRAVSRPSDFAHFCGSHSRALAHPLQCTPDPTASDSKFACLTGADAMTPYDTPPLQDKGFTAMRRLPKLAPVTPLHANKLFSRVPAAELAGLMDVTREVSLRAGEFIFEEGDPGDAVYVVKEGTVQISTRLEGGHRSILTRIGPGDLFGELAALDDALRSASASAETDTVLYRIPREYIVELLGRSPQFTLALVRDISHRLREFNRQHVRSLLEFERLSLVGRFANSIVHDLKNPL